MPYWIGPEYEDFRRDDRQMAKQWAREKKWELEHPGAVEAAEQWFWTQHFAKEAAEKAAEKAAAKAAARAAKAAARAAKAAAAAKARDELNAVKTAVAGGSGTAIMLNAGPASVVVAVAGSVKARHSVVSPDGWTTVVPRGTRLVNASD